MATPIIALSVASGPRFQDGVDFAKRFNFVFSPTYKKWALVKTEYFAQFFRFLDDCKGQMSRAEYLRENGVYLVAAVDCGTDAAADVAESKQLLAAKQSARPAATKTIHAKTFGHDGSCPGNWGGACECR